MLNTEKSTLSKEVKLGKFENYTNEDMKPLSPRFLKYESLNNTQKTEDDNSSYNMPTILRSPLGDKTNLLNTVEINNLVENAKNKFYEVMGSNYKKKNNNNFMK